MIKSIVFDLDGVLYCGDKATEGAVTAVAGLLESGLEVFYLTNNSGKRTRQIVEKLRNLGFPAEPENTYCSAAATAKYLAKEKLSPVYLVGTEGLRVELSECGIEAKESPEVSAVVVGFDPLINYCKIAAALEAIFKGAKLVVANSDPWYPAENGKRLPGTGAMAGAVVGATGHKPDFIVGKPNTYMLELLCREHGFSANDILVAGDSPESDIEMANKFGCKGVLFDPENAFPEFSGAKIKKLSELVKVIRAIRR